MGTWGYARQVQAVEVGGVLAYLILGGVCLTSDGVEGFSQMCGPAYGDKESRDSHSFAVLVQERWRRSAWVSRCCPGF